LTVLEEFILTCWGRSWLPIGTRKEDEVVNKRKPWVVAVAFALVFETGGILQAAQKKSGSKRSPDEIFARLDKNGNNKLSLEEYIGKKADDKATKAGKRFKKSDKDADGFLTLGEFKASRQKRRKGQRPVFCS